jgi:acetyltransferase-like isoleucine patch superfamily enzyme
MKISEFITKIKRRETPFYERLYRVALAARNFEIPYIKGLHDLGYHERRFRVRAWRSFWRVVYHQPLFRSRCVECGKRLYIDNTGQGLPLVENNIQLYLGDDVFLYDRITLAGLTITDKPRLIIGNHSAIGQPGAIFVGNEVKIGDHCLISTNLIADNPGHNLNYKDRFKKLHKILIGRIEIGDYVYCGRDSQIVGNVTIGFGAIIGASSVVTRNVPPFCIASGNPARIIKKLPFPKEMIEILGEDEYQKYLDAEIEV